MTKQTGIIITVVVAVLTLCCSVSCCGAGIYIFAAGEDLDVSPALGLLGVCPAFLVWVVPLLVWFFLVLGEEDTQKA